VRVVRLLDTRGEAGWLSINRSRHLFDGCDGTVHRSKNNQSRSTRITRRNRATGGANAGFPAQEGRSLVCTERRRRGGGGVHTISCEPAHRRAGGPSQRTFIIGRSNQQAPPGHRGIDLPGGTKQSTRMCFDQSRCDPGSRPDARRAGGVHTTTRRRTGGDDASAQQLERRLEREEEVQRKAVVSV
jgi:hypothetical protein